MRGELARTPRLERRAAVVVNEHRSRGGEREERLELDLPEVGSWLFTQELLLQPGSPTLLEILPDPERPGACRALVVAVDVE